jgi:hypothetical protein
MTKLIDRAVVEGQLWGQAAAEVTLERIADERPDEFRRRELIGFIYALLRGTLATIEREHGRAFAKAWEAAARDAIEEAFAAASTRMASPSQP